MNHLAGQELTVRSTTAKDSPGARVTDGLGRIFRYVKAGNNISKKGIPCAFSASADSVATAKHFGGFKAVTGASIPKTQKFAGISVGQISTSQYGYLLCCGPFGGPNNYYALTDGGVANNDYLIKDESTAGMVDTYAKSVAGTQIAWIIGMATAADSGSYLAKGYIKELWGGPL